MDGSRRDRTVSRCCVVLACVMLLWVGCAGAAFARVKLEVVQAFGALRYKSPGSVIVRLTNDGPGFRGTLVLCDEKTVWGFKSIQPVMIPAHGKEEFEVDFPLGSQYLPDHTFQLLDLAGTTQATQVVKTDPGGHLFIGTSVAVLDASPAFDFVARFGRAVGDDEVPPPRPRNGTATPEPLRTAHAIVVASIGTSGPENPCGYGAVNQIVVARNPWSLNMNLTQQEALMDWVYGGGTLLVVASDHADSLSAMPLAALLPATGLQDRRINVEGKSPFADTIKSTKLIKSAPTGKVLLTWNRLPILTVGRWGAGYVYFATVDLSDERLLNPRMTQAAWVSILSTRYRRYHTDHAINWEEADRDLAPVTPPEIATPSLPMLALVWFVYAVIVGPLNFWLLRRRDRKTWVYVSIPAVAFVFAALTIVIGQSRRGTHDVFRQVITSRVFDGDLRVGSRLFASLYSAQAGLCRLALPPRSHPVAQGLCDGSGRGDWNIATIQGVSHPWEIDIDERPHFPREVSVEETSSLAGPIRFRLVSSTRRTTGIIDNLSNITGHAFVLVNDHISKVFTLPRGHLTVDVPLSMIHEKQDFPSLVAPLQVPSAVEESTRYLFDSLIKGAIERAVTESELGMRPKPVLVIFSTDGSAAPTIPPLTMSTPVESTVANIIVVEQKP